MTTTPPDKATAATKTATSAAALNGAASTKVTSPTEGNEILTENSSLQFLYDAIDKLNPEKNDLNLVPKEITSSTLTTRLRGVCRINRLIDYASDLRHSFIEYGVREVYQKCIDELCGWILDKKIIENIFGPNCHVEIIKQSHTILTFIAQALDDEHVNVIWSASLLKHCGRQVLDLLTTLVRHMRTGPVLHLYWLVRNLSTEEHTEHTLSLTSCILRYIWLHSPCINQVHFLQKSQEAQSDPASNEDQENSPHELSEPSADKDAVESRIYSLFTERKFSRQCHREHIKDVCATLPTTVEESRKLSHFMNPHDNTFDTPRTATTDNTTSTNTTSTNDYSLTYGKSKSEEDDIEWYNECMNQSRLGNGNSFDDQSTERSISSRSNSDHDEKCLQQSLEDAIKGLDRAMNPRKQRTLTSPVSETLASGAGGDIPRSDDAVKQDVNDLDSAPASANDPDSSQQDQSMLDDYDEYECPSDTAGMDDEEFAKHSQWIVRDLESGHPFLDNTSDVSACCSEEKNMEDFEDDSENFLPGDNTNGTDNPSANSSSSDIGLLRQPIPRRKNRFAAALQLQKTLKQTLNSIHQIRGDSTSSTRDSDAKLNNNPLDSGGRLNQELGDEQVQQKSAATIAEFEQIKAASLNLTTITTQICSDDDLKKLSEYNLANLNEPGKTLLWDLLQDGKIEHLGANLYADVETTLVNLVMSFGGKFIRYKFIEACLENLALGKSVIISLRLLPRFMSFGTVARSLEIETYSIVLWAEEEHNMSKNFFKNLVDYYGCWFKSCEQELQQLERRPISPIAEEDNNRPIATAASKRISTSISQYSNQVFPHIDGIIMRMTFLSFIYSKSFSPASMKLSKDQMDQLWDNLTSDPNPKASDVLFQWIYQQAISEDLHGIDDELMDYILKCKMPSLRPLRYSLRGLKLLEQLLWIRQENECCHEQNHPAAKLLWEIGFDSLDDDVGMAAIRMINHFYVYTNHAKSVECKQSTDFMRNCMRHLFSALYNLNLPYKESIHDTSITMERMQKVILLIRTHLEVFKARWSYYLRTLQLNNEADLTSHRLNAHDIKLTMTLRLVVQSASTSDKVILELQPNDFIGEMRAEIVKWWFTLVDRDITFVDSDLSPSTSASADSPPDQQSSDKPASEEAELEQSPAKEAANHRISGFTKFLLESHDKLKLLSQNQEILIDWDERQIHEFDFKDFQVIYVLTETKANELGGRGSAKSEESSVPSSSSASYPTIDTIPAIAFLHTPKFERLIEVAQFLSTFKRKESVELTNKAKNLSRRVWEIIQILPTSPNYKETLKLRGIDDKYLVGVKQPITQNILSPDCPQRLLYSLQILDILKSPRERPNWGPTFIRKGGLADLLEVFLSGKLLPSDADEEWNEWLQECLAYLLKLLYQLGTRACVSREQSESSHHQPRGQDLATMLNKKFGLDGGGSSRRGSSSGGSSKRLRRSKSKLHGGGATTEDRVMIPLLSEDLLKLLADKGEQVSSTMIRILDFVTKRRNEQIYITAMPSRAMIVHHVMAFLSSWCKSDPKFPETLDLIVDCPKYEQLLKALLLDDNDPSTQREASHGFFKLHYSCVARSLELASELNSSSSSSESNPAREHSSPPDNNQSDTSSTSAAATATSIASDLPRLATRFSADLLVTLIKFLPIAEAMRPPKPFHRWIPYGEYIHEINLPGCKDYFWLVCRLIEAPYYAYSSCHPPARNRRRTHSKGSDESDEHREQQLELSANGAGDGGGQDTTVDSSGIFDCAKSLHGDALSIDLNDLCKYLAAAIRRRLVYETRDYSVEDDTLRGMLMMMVMVIRRNATFRYTKDAQLFIVELYNYLFAPPTEQHRYLPKCKSAATRSTAFDLMIALVEQCPENYMGLLDFLKSDQHQAVVKCSHPSDYWPHDDCRSETGFVGLINLGATCYLATCMQHLFMIPDLRYAILSIQDPKAIRHGEIMKELQKIFAFLLESERKAFNPRNFCKVYTMDNHPLNIAEQTDMTEFLTDLITKIEESSPVLRQIIKNLFSGTLSNNVVSLDCPHISRTTEEFYTLRVQVADMRNLNDSLDELTIKDTLEGDNMYTCSTCEKKVRAEKRACIVKLPRILCFNTMRYTFNMTTMTKEKVNTHFSFPLKLDMADYLESNLMKRSQQSSSPSTSTGSNNSCSSRNSSTSGHESNNSSTTTSAAAMAANVSPKDEQQPSIGDDQDIMQATNSAASSTESSNDAGGVGGGGHGGATPLVSDENQPTDDTEESETVYELIGVTVHTGNADGGHYYCFIRDCEDSSMDKPKWYLFNDAEVKTFDDTLIGTECYGGELTTKSYDAINDRFMDFSIEKTNSAYMLFYKRVDYKYRSKSVALRYLESDTQRSQYVLPAECPTKLLDELILSHERRNSQEVAAAKLEENSSATSEVKSEQGDSNKSNYDGQLEAAASRYSAIFSEVLDFRKLCQLTYDDFVLPRHLANWIWHENLKFSRDQYIFEHNYFDFMWQICANVPRTLTQPFMAQAFPESFMTSDDRIAIGTMHLAIVFVLGVLINSREKPNLANWTDLIRKQFNSSQAASDWAMQLIDDEDSWLKHMLLKCPVDTVRQLFQRVYSELTGGGSSSTKQHKKIRLVK